MSKITGMFPADGRYYVNLGPTPRSLRQINPGLVEFEKDYLKNGELQVQFLIYNGGEEGVIAVSGPFKLPPDKESFPTREGGENPETNIRRIRDYLGRILSLNKNA